MTVLDAIALFIAAMLGGALNSVAGGGTFLTLPTLIFTGVPAISANTTSTVALWPGSVASASAYRKEFTAQRSMVWSMGLTSVVGGYLGARLLLGTSEDTFVLLLPYLMLTATLLFAFGRTITSLLRGRLGSGGGSSVGGTIAATVAQLIVATYGGYFGGGIGFLMLALLTVTGLDNIHTANALKNVLASCINGVAVITFIATGAVLWPQAITMIAGAIMGGYGGGVLAQRLNPVLVRRFVIGVGIVLTTYFFLNAYVFSR